MGGLKVIDQQEADDKIIAVLENDHVWGDARDLGDVPEIMIDRLQHYFSTYKLVPDDSNPPKIEIEQVFGRDHALEVVEAALADYKDEFGHH